MSLNERLFIVVPLVSMICNLLLLLAVLSARKSRLVNAFIVQQAVFTAWTAGSLFMRMTVWPGPEFWYMVSITGIFLVPFAIFNFVYCYTEAKGSFLRVSLFVFWVMVAVLNMFNVFITDPHMTVVAGERRFEYGISPWIALPLVVAVLTLGLAWCLVYQNCRAGKATVRQFTPMIIGVSVMLIGTASAMLPQMVSLPVDTFSCCVNAVCLYYMLCRRRVVQLRSFATDAPVYALSVICSTLILVNGYEPFVEFFDQHISTSNQLRTVAIALLFSAMTVLISALIRFLMGNLLLRGTEEQEEEIRQFSTAVNKTLHLDELLGLYRDFLQQNLPGQTARVFLRDDSGNYQMHDSTRMELANADELTAGHPLVELLQRTGRSVTYAEFTRTRGYRAMWQKEKDRLEQLNVTLAVPVLSGGELVAVTLFSGEPGGHGRRRSLQGQLSFLESTAAVLASALNNAMLYDALEKKAQRDPLTNLYNRSYFQENIAREFELCRKAQLSLLLISFDDFHLYNELYGSAEGDRILKRFGEALVCLTKGRGMVARYSGKEFAVSFPFGSSADAAACAEHARDWLNGEILRSGEKTRKFLTFCAGISSYPSNAVNVDELFTYAGMAVYLGKRDGKNKIVRYQKENEGARIAAGLRSKRELAENCAPTIYALTAAIDAKDHYTFSHSNHVAEYAAALARELQLDAEHVEIIRQAGLLHDIGKIGTPEAILSKKERLTDEEYAVVKQHVEASISMIRYLPSLDYVVPSVLGHHERWDGRGYPRGIAGESIPIGARCLCLADSFDAMISRRSYKEAMSVDCALEEIRRNLGTQFDPQLGRVFIELVESGRMPILRDQSKPEEPVAQSAPQTRN